MKRKQKVEEKWNWIEETEQEERKPEVKKGG